MGHERSKQKPSVARPVRQIGRSRQGFTLIELLLVLVLISIVAGLVAPRLANRGNSARLSAAKAEIDGSLSTALDLFELDAGRYPTTEQGLDALVAAPSLDPVPRNWSGPYVRGGLPVDPWGNPYHYRFGSEREGLDYDLYSWGPDAAEGGGDDIFNGAMSEHDTQ